MCIYLSHRSIDIDTSTCRYFTNVFIYYRTKSRYGYIWENCTQSMVAPVGGHPAVHRIRHFYRLDRGLLDEADEPSHQGDEGVS